MMDWSLLSVDALVDRVEYSQYTNKQLLAIPVGVFVVSLLILLGAFIIAGTPVQLGVDFSGGTEFRVAPDSVEGSPEAVIEEEFPDASSIQQVPAEGTFIVTFRSTDLDTAAVSDDFESLGFTIESSSTISASFGSGSQITMIQGVLVAFGGMSIVTFVLFREFIPSVTVVASALSDLIVPLAFMSLFGIQLTLGTVAALLMLIGYSVDSDMVLNDKVLRQPGSFYESVDTAMRTGLSMSTTSLIAMGVMAIAGTLFGVSLLRNIGLIIGVGLLVDIMNTYLMNITLLRWYKHNYIGS
jgi:preprotein translocase subunit SecF